MNIQRSDLLGRKLTQSPTRHQRPQVGTAHADVYNALDRAAIKTTPLLIMNLMYQLLHLGQRAMDFRVYVSSVDVKRIVLRLP